MYCKECGKQIEDNSKFCNFCGAKQKTTLIPQPQEKNIGIQDNEDNLHALKRKNINTPDSKIPTKKYWSATVAGIILMLISFTLYSSKGLKYLSREELQQILIFEIVLRIIFTIWAVNIAKKLQRSKFGWGIFTFFITPLSLFIIGLLRAKKMDDSNCISHQSKSENLDYENDKLNSDNATLNESPRVFEWKITEKQGVKSESNNEGTIDRNVKVSKAKNNTNKKSKVAILLTFLVSLIIVVLSYLIYFEYYDGPWFSNWVGNWVLDKNIGNLIYQEAKYKCKNKGHLFNEDIESFMTELLQNDRYIEIQYIPHIFEDDQYLIVFPYRVNSYDRTFARITSIDMYELEILNDSFHMIMKYEDDKIITDIVFDTKNKKELKRIELKGLVFNKIDSNFQNSTKSKKKIESSNLDNLIVKTVQHDKTEDIGEGILENIWSIELIKGQSKIRDINVGNARGLITYLSNDNKYLFYIKSHSFGQNWPIFKYNISNLSTEEVGYGTQIVAIISQGYYKNHFIEESWIPPANSDDPSSIFTLKDFNGKTIIEYTCESQMQEFLDKYGIEQTKQTKDQTYNLNNKTIQKTNSLSKTIKIGLSICPDIFNPTIEFYLRKIDGDENTGWQLVDKQTISKIDRGKSAVYYKYVTITETSYFEIKAIVTHPDYIDCDTGPVKFDYKSNGGIRINDGPCAFMHQYNRKKI